MEERLSQILDQATEISSGYQLDDVDTPFRVLAGPGAGKTHWLVTHIEHVIETSKRLGPSQRIACISYTTAAAEEVEQRLGSSAAHVDTSTIHSFLYRNVVKPYLPWVKNEDGDPLVDYWNLDGHRPHRSNYGKVNKWFEQDEVTGWPNFGAFLGSSGAEPEEVFEFFQSLYWDWSEEEGWRIRFDWQDFLKEKFPYSTENLYRYKQLFWEQGTLDHSDVLYFAARIIAENPELARFLAARYPYVFVDEFQDTTSAQTKVLAALAEAGSVTGVIGDMEQSIFGSFTGAAPEDLIYFEADGQETYHITSNRRSTRSILNVLNRVRQGSEQTYYEGEEERDEIAPAILVGPPEEALNCVRERVDGEVQMLVRKNEVLRELVGDELPDGSYEGVWEELYSLNPYRTEWLEAVLEATHEAKDEGRYGARYGQAVRILYRALRTQNGRLHGELFSGDAEERKLLREERRRTAAALLPFLLMNHEEHREMNGLEFYLALRSHLEKLPPNASMVRTQAHGQFGQLLQETDYEALYATARLTSGDGSVKTIHKSKGEEYPIVLTYRGRGEADDRDATLDHLLGPSESDGEERRVTYVGLSRAEDRLYICVDGISEGDEKNLKAKGFVVEHLCDEAVAAS